MGEGERKADPGAGRWRGWRGVLRWRGRRGGDEERRGMKGLRRGELGWMVGGDVVDKKR